MLADLDSQLTIEKTAAKERTMASGKAIAFLPAATLNLRFDLPVCLSATMRRHLKRVAAHEPFKQQALRIISGEELPPSIEAAAEAAAGGGAAAPGLANPLAAEQLDAMRLKMAACDDKLTEATNDLEAALSAGIAGSMDQRSCDRPIVAGYEEKAGKLRTTIVELRATKAALLVTFEKARTHSFPYTSTTNDLASDAFSWTFKQAFWPAAGGSVQAEDDEDDNGELLGGNLGDDDDVGKS